MLTANQFTSSVIIFISCLCAVFTQHQVRICNLFTILIILNSLVLAAHLYMLLRRWSSRSEIRRQLASEAMATLSYLFLSIGFYLFFTNRLDIKYLIIFNMLALVSAFVSIFTSQFSFPFYLPSPVMNYSLLAFFIYFKVSQTIETFVWYSIWVVSFMLFAVYILLCLLKLFQSGNLLRKFKRARTFDSLRHSGIVAAFLIALNRLWRLVYFVLLMVVAYIYLSNNDFHENQKFDQSKDFVYFVCVFNLICGLADVVVTHVFKNQMITGATNYFWTGNDEKIFTIHKLFFPVKFLAFLGGAEKNKLILNPRIEADRSNIREFDFPENCTRCNKRRIKYLARPCNHIGLCEFCQTIRLANSQECFVCEREVVYLWNFEYKKHQDLILLKKIVFLKNC